MKNKYILLWVVSFLIQALIYPSIFKVDVESTSLIVAVPYVLTTVLTFVIQQFKLLGE